MKIAFLTSGGIAPCLSASIASLIQNYTNKSNNFKYIGYQHGYYGLLKGKSILCNPIILSIFVIEYLILSIL